MKWSFLLLGSCYRYIASQIEKIDMDAFEYFVVLSSLILGLGIAQILMGVADMLSNLKQVRPGLAHSILIFNVFLLHIQEWWYTYQYMEEIMLWSLPIVLFLLVYPILLFMLARMLVPTGLRSHETDLEAYFYDQWPWFYGLLFGIALASLLQNVIISGLPLTGQIFQIGFMASLILFIVLKVKSRALHTLYLILQAMIWIIYVIVDPFQLA